MLKKLIAYLIILSMILTLSPIVNADQLELMDAETKVIVFDATYEIQYSQAYGFETGLSTLRIGYSKNIQFSALKFDIGNIPGTITGAKFVANGSNAVSSTETAYPIRLGSYPTYLNDGSMTPWNEENISPYGYGSSYIKDEMIVNSFSGEYVVDLSDTLIDTIKPNAEVAFAIYSTASWGLINTRFASPAGTKGPKLEISYIPYDDDVTPPHWEDGNLRISKETTNDVTLEWTGAVDNDKVVGYRIKKGTQVFADNITDTSYTISGLTDDTDYIFTVQAYDQGGNLSTDGPSVKYHKGFSYGDFKLLDSCFVINSSPRNLINQKNKTSYMFNWYSLNKAMLYVKLQFNKSETLDVDKLRLIVPVSRVGQTECEAYIYPAVNSNWDEYTITDINRPAYSTKEPIGSITITPSTTNMVFDLKDHIVSSGTYTFAIELNEGKNISLNMNQIKAELEYEKTGGANKSANSLAMLPTLYPVADSSVRPQGGGAAAFTQALSPKGARMYAWPTDKATNYFVVRYEIPEIQGKVKSASLDLSFDYTYGTSDATVDVWKYSALAKNSDLPWSDDSPDISKELPSVLSYTPGKGDFKGVLTSAPGQCTINLDAEDIVGDSTIAYIIRVNPGTEPRVFLNARENASGSGAKLNIEYEVDESFDATVIDNNISFLTTYRPDSENDSFKVRLDGATFSKEILTEGVDFVVQNLPRGLKIISAYTTDEQSAVFKVGGASVEPISEDFEFSVIIKWPSLKDSNANSSPLVIKAFSNESSIGKLYSGNLYDKNFEFWDTVCKVVPYENKWNNLMVALKLLSEDDLSDNLVTRGYVNDVLTRIPNLTSGFDNNGFGISRPDDYITFNEAYKVLVTALGYGLFAEESGGYPFGYIIEAKNLGISDGIIYNANDHINFEVFAHLLFNTLHAKLPETKLYKTSDKSLEISQYKYSDTQLITEAYGIKRYRGTVIGADRGIVSVYYNTDKQKKDLNTQINALDLLSGAEAEFWVNDDENSLVAIYPISTVKFDYITGRTGDNISTFISGEELSLSNLLEVKVNGKKASFSDITLDMMCRIVITNEEVKYIDAFSLTRGGFFSSANSMNVLYKDYKEGETPQYINVENKNVYTMLNGSVCDITQVPDEAIIDYYSDEKSVWIFACDLGLIGEVKEYTNNSIILDDTEYVFDDKWLFSSNMGKDYVVLTDTRFISGALIRAYFAPSGKIRYVFSNIEDNSKEFYCVVGSVKSKLDGDFITVLRPSLYGEIKQEYELKLKNSPLSIADIEMRAGSRGGADSVMYVELNDAGKVIRVSEPEWALYNASTYDFPKSALTKFDSANDRIITTGESGLTKNYYVKDTLFISIYDRYGNYNPHIVTWDRMKSRGAVNGMVVRIESSRPYSKLVTVVKGYDLLTTTLLGDGIVTKITKKATNEEIIYVKIEKNGSTKEYYLPEDLSENIKKGDIIQFSKDGIIKERANDVDLITGETNEIRIITPIIDSNDLKTILKNNLGAKILIDKIDNKFFLLNGEEDYFEIIGSKIVYKYDRSSSEESALKSSKLSDIPIGCRIWFLPLGYSKNNVVIYEEVLP